MTMALESPPAASPDATEAPRTVLPARPDSRTPAPARRAIGGVSRDAVLVFVGALASSFATTMLLFGRLTPLSGKFGFVVVFFLVFLATYTVLVSLTERTTAIVDRVMTLLLAACAAAALFALFSVVIFVLVKGFSALRHANFYTEDMSVAGPLDPLTVGGILHAIAGTLIMTLIALVITVPLALATAVYMTESGSRWAGLVRTVVTAMTALPSILAGLFIFATWILILGFERSGLAAAIAMSIMMLPIIVRSADVVLRLVPGNLREAAAALGAPQWRTVWHVVLPTARSGLTTSVILGVARGIGETAPVLLTAGFTSTMNLNPRANPMVSLPLAAYELVRSPQENLVARGFGAAAVLMLLVLVLFTLARILGGRPAGRLSKRGARRTAARSAEDVRRFDARALRDQDTDHSEVMS
ncbi:MAG: phosphate transporter permease PstA [Actinomycetota bacterium]|jgi:phosphate transport system permease protein